MTDLPFIHHRPAALALLNRFPELSHKAAGFCGHMAVAEAPTEKQVKWLNVLLRQNKLPAYEGGVHD